MTRTTGRRLLLLMLMLVPIAHPWSADTHANPRVPIAAPLFAFRSGFWVNLHSFLYVLGRARNGEPDSHRAAVVQAPLDVSGLETRPEADRAVWDAAIDFYAAGLSKRDAVFDDDLVGITKALAQAADAPDLRGVPVDPALAATLEKAGPLYRAVWWPRHARVDAARTADLQIFVDKHGAALVARLTALYRTAWPVAPRVIEVSAYANWAGAYSSTSHGGLIVFASTDEAISGALGLETLLHESSHQWDDEIDARLRAIAANVGVKVPPDLSHALIFFTSGAVVSEAIPGHVPYAVKFGLWDRGGFRGLKPVLDQYWQPYINGRVTFDQAIAAILAHLPK